MEPCCHLAAETGSWFILILIFCLRLSLNFVKYGFTSLCRTTFSQQTFGQQTFGRHIFDRPGARLTRLWPHDSNNSRWVDKSILYVSAKCVSVNLRRGKRWSLVTIPPELFITMDREIVFRKKRVKFFFPALLKDKKKFLKNWAKSKANHKKTFFSMFTFSFL